MLESWELLGVSGTEGATLWLGCEAGACSTSGLKSSGFRNPSTVMLGAGLGIYLVSSGFGLG